MNRGRASSNGLGWLLACAACWSGCAQVESEKGEAPPIPRVSGAKGDGASLVRGAGALALPGVVERELVGRGALDAWEIELGAGAEIALEITQRGTSRGFDTTLYLFGPRRADGSLDESPVALDDDGGWGLLSRIDSWEAEEAGTYLVVVGSYRPGQGGRYRLEARCSSASCAPQKEGVEACVFGEHIADLGAERSAVVVVSRKLLQEGDTLEPKERDQIIAAVGSTYGELEGIEDAFAVVDRGQINRLDLWDASRGGAFIAYEFGAGDNSYGAIFAAGSSAPAALIWDGAIVECEAGWGPQRRACMASAPCAAGLACHGAIEGRGACLDQSAAPVPGQGEECGGVGTCAEGLVCAGASLHWGGLCVPAWMRRGFGGEELSVPIPKGDQGGVEVKLESFGLATVHTDVRLNLWIDHPRPAALRVTLTSPSGTEAVLVDNDPGGVTLYRRGEILRDLPGDEAANGVWTLRAVDDGGGSGRAGSILEFGLEITSRWD